MLLTALKPDRMGAERARLLSKVVGNAPTARHLHRAQVHLAAPRKGHHRTVGDVVHLREIDVREPAAGLRNCDDWHVGEASTPRDRQRLPNESCRSRRLPAFLIAFAAATAAATTTTAITAAATAAAATTTTTTTTTTGPKDEVCARCSWGRMWRRQRNHGGGGEDAPAESDDPRIRQTQATLEVQVNELRTASSRSFNRRIGNAGPA